MSLEDSPELPFPDTERGTKVCTVEGGNIFQIMPDTLYLGNHHKNGQSFFVEIEPADGLRNKKQKVIIWLMPASRKDEFAPDPRED